MVDIVKQEIKLFYCYAREDRDLRDQFEKSLSGLKRHYHLGNWYDREILAGQAWEEIIAEQLNSANIIFLLISPDFIASDYCYGIEMQRALERQAEGNCLVIAILLRPTYWEDEPFGHLQLLPTDARPITRWPDRDEAFQDVVTEISRAIKDLLISPNNSETSHDLEKKMNPSVAEPPILTTTKEGSFNFGFADFLDTFGRHNLALAEFEEAIRLEPNNAVAYNKKGMTLSSLDRYEEALAAFDQAIQLDPNYAHAYASKGFAFRNLKRYEAALTAYEWAIRLDPKHAYYYASKGDLLRSLKRYEEALTAYEQAIRLDPKNGFTYTTKGDLLRSLKRYEEALAAYEQAIRLDPKRAYLYLNKGDMLRYLKRYEEALAAYEKAIHFDHKYAIAYNNKGNALYNLNRYEEALAAYEQAIRLNPKYAIAYNNKGDMLRYLKRDVEAEQALAKAHQLEHGT